MGGIQGRAAAGRQSGRLIRAAGGWFKVGTVLDCFLFRQVMSSDSFQQHLKSLQQQIEVALRRSLNGREWPEPLERAVEYSLMAGGKRLRPVLVLLASDLCGGSPEAALAPACAIEMIHTYSLIHDDLPAMDNDDYRRGRLTSHKVFGEALAILAGDALLTLAFEVLGESTSSAEVRAELMCVLARAAGGAGMVGGQVLDLEAERGRFPGLESRSGGAGGLENSFPSGISGTDTSKESAQNLPGFVEKTVNAIPATEDSGVEHLNRIHRMKTGALIAAALELGAVVAGATSQQRLKLRNYGLCIGLAFQIADDLLDVTGDAQRLGKTPGRDVDLGKLTYPALLGIETSRRQAEMLVQEACDSVSDFGLRSGRLQELARFIVERDH